MARIFKTSKKQIFVGGGNLATTKIWKVIKRMDHVIGYATNKEKTKIEIKNYEMYVDDFRSAVKQDTQAMIELVLEHKDKVLPAFIDSLFSGVELSEQLKEIEPNTIEKMFHKFPCDLKTHRASYFCGIIENMNFSVWSMEVMNQLKNLR